MNITLSINTGIFILSIIESCIITCGLAFFIKSTGSIATANYLGSVFWLAMLLFDLPVGYLADHFGPKRVFLSSILLRAFAFLIFFKSEGSLVLLTIANFIAGISVAFMSSAFFMQMNLLQKKHMTKVDNQTFVSNTLLAKSAGFILGCFLSYLTMHVFVIEYIWLVSVLLSLFLFAYISIAWDFVKGNANHLPFLHLKIALNLIKERPELKKSIFNNAILTLFTSSFLANWIVIFVPSLEKSSGTLALAFVSFYFFKILTVLLFKKVTLINKIKLRNLFIIFWLCIFLFNVNIYALQLFLFSIAILALSIIEIYLKQGMLENLEENQSGVILSIYNLLENLGGGLGLVLSGYLLQFLPVIQSWTILGTVIIILLYFIANTQQKEISQTTPISLA